MRPSKDQVDGAIENYWEEAQCAIERNCAGILAAEVVALRDDLRDAYYHRAMAIEYRAELNTALAERDAAMSQLHQAQREMLRLRREQQEAHDKLVGAESELREDLAEESLGKAAVATGSGTFSVSLFDLLETSAAALARAEALPAQWREKASRPQSPLFTNAEHALTTFTFERCADELEAALQGAACGCHDEDVSGHFIRHYCAKHWAERGGE